MFTHYATPLAIVWLCFPSKCVT